MEQLAIHGGVPVRKTMLNYGHQWIQEDDIQAVVEVLKGDWLTTGPAVSAFEKAVAEFVGAKHAVAVNSGTAALHAAAFAAGIGPGDEVIVTPMSFVASANCILYMGGTPVFADVNPDSLNIDPIEIQKKITGKTKAIIAVDYAGQPCQHAMIHDIAKQHNLVVIEDASHALGAAYYGKKVGTLQPLTTFSFHPVKHITTGEGGMVVTDDPEMAKKMRSFRTHGVDVDFQKRAEANLWQYDVVTLGYNYRLPDINCALGISQLKKISRWIERRKHIAQSYDTAFSSLLEISPLVRDPGCESSWHLYVIRLNLESLSADRTEIFKALRHENIGVNVHYIPIPSLTSYQKRGYQNGLWPNAEGVYERILSLPIFPLMSDDDLQSVISAVQKVIKYYRK
jgi:perosamine synthetase